MALSKAIHGSKLFTQTGSGTDDLTGSTAFETEVNSSSTSVQWKMKELLFQRSANGSIDLHMYVVNRATGVKFLVKSVLATTSTYVRIASNLVDGEYFVDSDCEVRVESANLGVSETWSLRLIGQVIG